MTIIKRILGVKEVVFWKGLRARSDQKPAPFLPSRILSDAESRKIGSSVKDLAKFMSQLFAENDDFVQRHFEIFNRFSAVMFYFSDLANELSVNESLLKSLMHAGEYYSKGKSTKLQELQHVLMDEVLYHTKTHAEGDIPKIVEACFRGDTVIAIEGLETAIIVTTRFVEKRAIDQPMTEQALRGAREGFIEPIGTNISLLRYRLQSPDFRVKAIQIGRLTKTKVAVCYIEGIVNPRLVDEVFRRLSVIDIDGILDAGYLEQFIEDNHWSPFPQVVNSERPDKTVANLLEGRVAIIADGSPFALLIPAVFTQFYQTLDDYTERFLMGTLVRAIRLLALISSLIFSSLYVSLISFNQDLIPTQFAVAVAGGRAGVPYPAFIEVLIMEVSMEVLREATLRLPQQVGGALSIVGVLVIGQAAVSAGFVSPITVVVVAITTIGSFATPAYNAAIALRMLRFLLVALAGLFGLYGVMLGLILIANHLLSLKSFGVRYLAPIVPANWKGLRDTIVRIAFWWMPKRPEQLYPLNQRRISKESVEKAKQPRRNPFSSTDLKRPKRGK